MLGPYLEVVIAAIIWGSAGAFVKLLNLPPATISFFRLAVPTIILLAFFAVKKVRLFKGDNKLILSASLLNVVRTFLYFVGFTYTSIGNAVIIFFTWPIFVALLEIPFLKEKMTKKNAFLLLVAFFGMVLAYLNRKFSFSDHDFIGMAAMTLCSFANAACIIIFKKVGAKYSKFEMIFYQNIVGAFAFLPFVFINPLPSLWQSSTVIVYSILVGVIGFMLYFSALNVIKASTASFLTYFEPVSAILFGVILFAEKLSWNMIAGGLLIITSALMMKAEESQNLKLITE
jgi:drug/metabolite transporter (DMT)-like permease